jgi:hypothetical protein
MRDPPPSRHNIGYLTCLGVKDESSFRTTMKEYQWTQSIPLPVMLYAAMIAFATVVGLQFDYC